MNYYQAYYILYPSISFTCCHHDSVPIRESTIILMKKNRIDEKLQTLRVHVTMTQAVIFKAGTTKFRDFRPTAVTPAFPSLSTDNFPSASEKRVALDELSE